MGNNRQQDWWVKCSNCGLEHHITNFHRRLARTPDGRVVAVTTHEAGCLGYTLLSGEEATRYRYERRRTW